jgi:integrase
MSVRKRGNRWWYDFSVDHIRYRGSLPQARTKRQAADIEYHLRFSVYDGKDLSRNTTALSEFVDEVFWPWALVSYSTPRQTHWSHVAAVKEFFGMSRLREITPMQIERFKQHRVKTQTKRGKDRKPGTVNRDLGTLSRILSMAQDNSLIVENPAKRVRRLRDDNERIRYLTLDEQERLLAVMIGRYANSIKPIFIFAVNTGMRRGEILNLGWSDISWERNVIVVRKTKSGRDRSVPINSAVAEVLKARLQLISSGKVFSISPKTLSSAFTTLARRAGIENLRLHDLRHTFATRLSDAGIDPFTIADILGHRDLNITKRYTHVLESNRQRAVAALTAYRTSPLSQSVCGNNHCHNDVT